MTGQRGIAVRTTMPRWVRHDTADLEKRGNRYARWVVPGGVTNETYLQVKGAGGIGTEPWTRHARPWISM
jgi:hypothetical protein